MAELLQKCHEVTSQAIEYTKASPITQRIMAEPRLAIYGAAIFAFTAWLLLRATRYLAKPPIRSRPSTPDLEKPAARSFKAPPREPGGLLHPSHMIDDC